MQAIQLGPSGRSTPQLGFGCSGLMGALDRPSSLRLLEEVYASGIRHFDVAPMYGYGEAEACLGEFLARHPGECTVTTKYGIAAPTRGRGLLGPARRLAAPVLRVVPGLKRRLLRAADAVTGGVDKLPFTPEEARTSLERSLRSLRAERLDLWLLHEVAIADLPAGGDERLLRFLEDAKREGKIGDFGVGSGRALVRELERERPAFCRVVQTDWALPGGPEIPAASEGEVASFQVFHRVVAGGARPLQAAMVANPEAGRRWSSQTGVDLTQLAELGFLLLKAACVFSPEALFLFSSKRPKHIAENVAAVSGEALRVPAQRLYELLQTEGLPRPAANDRRVA